MVPVYPRVGGATLLPDHLVNDGTGLSPRGRGNRRCGSRRHSAHGSIPAWAGQPRPPGETGPTWRVYPRVGGATSQKSIQPAFQHGLSPRGRGNRHVQRVDAAAYRSIPAWAGQPLLRVIIVFLIGVYPRVGGATPDFDAPLNHPQGLSPRGRGNLSFLASPGLWRGSIPAWAGQPRSGGPPSPGRPVYPRVGGATCPDRENRDARCGLSPRGRGNLSVLVLLPPGDRSIPAWAGQPSTLVSIRPVCGVYPRVGGATFLGAIRLPRNAGLSPRGRGNLSYLRAIAIARGSIPAWAGQPQRARLFDWPIPVYPRVGGATMPGVARLPMRMGLSPRGRGNLDRYACH